MLSTWFIFAVSIELTNMASMDIAKNIWVYKYSLLLSSYREHIYSLRLVHLKSCQYHKCIASRRRILNDVMGEKYVTILLLRSWYHYNSTVVLYLYIRVNVWLGMLHIICNMITFNYRYVIQVTCISIISVEIT